MRQSLLSNSTGFTCHLQAGEYLGGAAPATVVEATEDNPARAFTLTTHTEEGTHATERERGEKLLELLQEPDLPLQEKQTLLEFLIGYHHVFSLEDGERGETDLVQMEINTGDVSPKKQPTRRIPFTLRQEVARQLDQMQKQGVIQPSRSPWASPVVLLRKCDGSHRFCVDYRGLNSVTKPDSYPLPRIEDLLDQLGQSVMTCCIKRWKLAGALVSPKGITRNSNSPCCVVNAVFSCESGCMRICQNPEARSVDEKYAAPQSQFWTGLRLCIPGRYTCVFSHSGATPTALEVRHRQAVGSRPEAEALQVPIRTGGTRVSWPRGQPRRTENKSSPSRSCSAVSCSKVRTQCSQVPGAVVLLPEIHP